MFLKVLGTGIRSLGLRRETHSLLPALSQGASLSRRQGRKSGEREVIELAHNLLTLTCKLKHQWYKLGLNGEQMRHCLSSPGLEWSISKSQWKPSQGCARGSGLASILALGLVRGDPQIYRAACLERL